MRLNFLASAIVVFGALITVVVGWLLGLDNAGMFGVFAGATTNTPSLGAAQQKLSSFPDISANHAALPALAYALIPLRVPACDN